jgi:hypothetical protein
VHSLPFLGGVLRERATSSKRPHHLPGFIAAPGDTNTLMVVVGIVLICAVLGVGNLYLRLHSLPERMAHKSQKLQFEIVVVLGLLSLFAQPPVLGDRVVPCHDRLAEF